MSLNKLVGVLSLTILLFSCKKDTIPDPVDSLKNGMLVLCEGLFQQNNASVSWVDFSSNSSNLQFFDQTNNRQLGDTGNDMVRYGGKIYIVVNVSSTIEVISASTGKSIKQISMIDNGVAKQPRSIAFSGSKAYISCYDGFVDVLDTTSLSIVTRIAVGDNPEGLAVANNRLFVANSGGLNFPNVDSTVSVIDLATNSEIQKITVGPNPGDLEVDAFGDVYVISRGDYGAVPSRMHRINSTTLVKEETFSFDASEMSVMNDQLLISYTDASSNQQVALFDAVSESMVNTTFLNLSSVQNAYEVQFNALDNHIYVSDAKDYVTTGEVFKFSQSGTVVSSFNVGLNPSKMVFFQP